MSAVCAEDYTAALFSIFSIQQVFIEQLLYRRHCARSNECRRKTGSLR